MRPEALSRFSVHKQLASNAMNHNNASFLQYAEQRRHDDEQKRYLEDQQQRQDYHKGHSQQHVHPQEASSSSSSYSQVNHILGNLHQERKHRMDPPHQHQQALSSLSFSNISLSTMEAPRGHPQERNDSLSSLSTFASTLSANANANTSAHQQHPKIMRPKKLKTDSRLF